ncbi:MAG: 2-oxoacid:ferredoxin oxidoreductase subunit beta, partial [Rhodospirillales bacterium]|nr:2-oxoacid:ferredoxin oxidoreductase subunit beta [Rhodospirillales bacterium]
MSFIRKPKVSHKGSTRNDLGLTRNEYDGAMSTLCAGCGHDSVTAAMTRAFFELSIPPHRAVKISGIGCSSKTTAYFMGQSHGANTVHGRMPSIATGASAANRELYCIGVSGDGDSLSIELGQFAHAMRRNLNMLYI